jgi:hypothetical protein
MVITPFPAGGIAVTVLALSKAAWRLGISLSKLHQDTQIVDNTVKNVAEELKLLGNECDLLYAGLEEVVSKNETGLPPPHDVDSTLWDCLATQVEETSRTVQEMELFVKSIRGEESSFLGQAQRQRRLNRCKDQIESFRTKVSRHTDNLRLMLQLINA